MQSASYNGSEIAVIGLASRFPRAGNAAEFWQHIAAGNECITFFSEDELIAAGIEPATVRDPYYVKGYGWLEHSEAFDNNFFHYSERDAALIDPQMRILHEVAWHALEDAGYNPETYARRIGLYVGASDNLYWQVLSTISTDSTFSEQFEAFQLNNKDFLATQIAYKLNLRGPALTIATACSTSLTAIHLACQALLGGECEIALAGGATISLPAKKGYLYQDGMILSPDGHCRTFDEQAAGIVGGNGAGMVVLKLLDEALADDDHIYAIVKGSAINNDGRRKLGYSAPSIEGQIDVIRMAQRAAQVAPETISYIEAHGTATRLGDPVEIEALTQAFNTSRRQFCAIGSIKSSIGHVDSAAGVAGFIKATLMLHHKQLPPAVNFEKPNSHIDFQHSPFYINQTLKPWQPSQQPFRVGVSAFGIGGTNAHVVLEEAPGRPAALRDDPYQLIPLSAHSPEQVRQLALNVRDFIMARPDLRLADIAYTLQTGRKSFGYRQGLACRSREALCHQLAEVSTESPGLAALDSGNPPHVIFMFPGGGTQYVRMGGDLLDKDYILAAELEQCLTILKKLTGIEYGALFYPPGSADARSITDIDLVQPFLFAFEYALARTLIRCGIQPHAMIGHSSGEFVAACLADVFSLEDALYAITRRSQLMQTMPEGAMLSVLASEAEVTQFLDERYSLAALNSTNNVVVSGSPAAIEQLVATLECHEYICRKLHLTVAGHSPIMEPILADFRRVFTQITLHPPAMPFISNLTGTWITDEQATNPAYWCQQLRQTVRFNDGLATLLDTQQAVFVEVGPGNALSSFVENHADRGAGHYAINTVRHVKEEQHDVEYLLHKLAGLWTLGLSIDWQALYTEPPGRRISLPGYPFKRTTFTIQADPFALLRRIRMGATGSSNQPASWFYLPTWKRTVRRSSSASTAPASPASFLVLLDDSGFGEQLCDWLERRHVRSIKVVCGEDFQALDSHSFRINPTSCDDYRRLLETIDADRLGQIVHMWSLTTAEPDFANAQAQGLYSVLALVKALNERSWSQRLHLTLISNGLHQVQANDLLMPNKATLLGALRVIPQELDFLTCTLIDLTTAHMQTPAPIDWLHDEIQNHSLDKVVAYREKYRWVPDYEPIVLESDGLQAAGIKPDGVYVITGGLGNLGLLFAEHLTLTHNAIVAIIARTALPPKNQWHGWRADDEANNHISRIIRRLHQIETLGGRIAVYQADVSDAQALTTAITAIEEQWGRIDGVIHAAAVPATSSTFARSVVDTDSLTCEEHFAAKVHGTRALATALEHKELDFCVVFSSLTSVLGGLGTTAYAAANSFMDQFVIQKNQAGHGRWLSINWDYWMVDTGQDADAMWHSINKRAIKADQGTAAFDKLLAWPEDQVLVSTLDLQSRLAQWSDPVRNVDLAVDLAVEPVSLQASANHAQAVLTAIWEEQLGQRNIDPHASFFALGGDSLKALSIIARIHKVFGRKLDLNAFFKHPTIANVLQLLDQQQDQALGTIPLAEEMEYYPLSPAQERLFILNQMHPTSTSYNLPQVMLLDSQVDREWLAECIQQLITRHEALRASFHLIKGKAVQHIHDHVAVEIAYRETTPNELDALLHSLMRPFRLDTPPLLRVALIKLAEQQSVLVLDIHHIIVDGASFSLFFKELSALYRRQSLPALPLRYRDYCVYMQRDDRAASLVAQKQFWLSQFEGDPPQLELPTDFARPEQMSYLGHTVPFELDRETSQQVNALVARHSTTRFVFFLAVFNVLLAKLSSQEDIVVGAPIQVRDHPEAQGIFGHFIDMLPLRNFPSDRQSFGSFLTDVSARSLQAFAHADVPYTDIVDLLKVKWQANRNPLFDVMIVMQSHERATTDLVVEPYLYHHTSSKFDLTLEIFEQDSQFSFLLEYCTELFSEQRMIQYIDYFKKIIRQVVAESSVLLSDIWLSSAVDVVELARSDLEFDWSE